MDFKTLLACALAASSFEDFSPMERGVLTPLPAEPADSSTLMMRVIAPSSLSRIALAKVTFFTVQL